MCFIRQTEVCAVCPWGAGSLTEPGLDYRAVAGALERLPLPIGWEGAKCFERVTVAVAYTRSSPAPRHPNDHHADRSSRGFRRRGRWIALPLSAVKHTRRYFSPRS